VGKPRASIAAEDVRALGKAVGSNELHKLPLAELLFTGLADGPPDEDPLVAFLGALSVDVEALAFVADGNEDLLPLANTLHGFARRLAVAVELRARETRAPAG
jgi:hypothetical protein